MNEYYESANELLALIDEGTGQLRAELAGVVNALSGAIGEEIARERYELDAVTGRLKRSISQRLAANRSRLESVLAPLAEEMNRQLLSQRERLAIVAGAVATPAAAEGASADIGTIASLQGPGAPLRAATIETVSPGTLSPSPFEIGLIESAPTGPTPCLHSDPPPECQKDVMTGIGPFCVFARVFNRTGLEPVCDAAYVAACSRGPVAPGDTRLGPDFPTLGEAQAWMRTVCRREICCEGTPPPPPPPAGCPPPCIEVTCPPPEITINVPPCPPPAPVPVGPIEVVIPLAVLIDKIITVLPPEVAINLSPVIDFMASVEVPIDVDVTVEIPPEVPAVCADCWTCAEIEEALPRVTAIMPWGNHAGAGAYVWSECGLHHVADESLGVLSAGEAIEMIRSGRVHKLGGGLPRGAGLPLELIEMAG